MPEVSVPPAWLDRLLWALTLVLLSLYVVAAALFLPRHPPARLDSTRTDAQSVRSAATMYVSENPGKCPTALELTSGGYLDSGRRTADAWDNDFRIDCAGDDILVSSAGPDGVYGTEDDIL